MIRVLALSSGRNQPSRRFRIQQHIGPLAALGVQVEERCPSVDQHARFPGLLSRVRLRYMAPLALGQALFNLANRVPGVIASHRFDVTWIERNFVPGLDMLAGMVARPRILDVDDAIWLNHPLGEAAYARFAARMDAVIAGNSYLANWLSRYCRNISILPTAIDCMRFHPAPARQKLTDSSRPLLKVGWTGTSGNFRFLELIETALARFLDETPDARLRIVADRPPSLAAIPAERLEFIQWTPENEAPEVAGFDIGLMPLTDDPWSRGKCSYKMLQYMAAGVPVIVSPVGMNAEVLAMGDCGLPATSGNEWLDALRSLRDDATRRASMGGAGRDIVTHHFDVPVVARRLAGVFHDAVGR